MPLGLYVSVPFCRTKCSYCNFASGLSSRAAFETYVARVLEDIRNSSGIANELGCSLEASVDSIYLGGGTPSILEPRQLTDIFHALREQFEVARDAEITVECAPGTLSEGLIGTLVRNGVNRVSLGAQSFVDREAHAVGRLHNRLTVLDEIERMREAGIESLNVDLIAGLPHQTMESWLYSVSETVATGVPHASVYMLEVDDESRLGRELLAGGARYHAHFVPDNDATADFYLNASETLNRAGIAQYEISNFALLGQESRHNLKYWTRQPYLGFGLDAHSMLPARNEAHGAVRFSTPDSLDAYMTRRPHAVQRISAEAALEEAFFLGLRLNRGVDLDRLRSEFGSEKLARCQGTSEASIRDGLLECEGTVIRLTPRGRLLSNEVFARFLSEEGAAGAGPRESALAGR